MSDISSKVDYGNYLHPEENDLGFSQVSDHPKESMDTALLREVKSLRSDLSDHSLRAHSHQRMILHRLEDIEEDIQSGGRSPIGSPMGSTNRLSDSLLVNQNQLESLQDQVLQLTTQLSIEQSHNKEIQRQLEDILEMYERRGEEVVQLQQVIDEKSIKGKVEFQHIYNKVRS